MAKGPFSQLDLSREQREQIGKMMGDQWHERKQLINKYLEKLPAADQKAMQDEIAANQQESPGRYPCRAEAGPAEEIRRDPEETGPAPRRMGGIQGLESATAAKSAIMLTR